MRILVLGLLLSLLAFAGAWDEVFKTTHCYQTPGSYGAGDGLESIVENRMPLSLDNFVALLEKYERDHMFVNPDQVAEAIIHRYKKDGYTYKADAAAGNRWQTQESEEVDKQDLINKVVVPEGVVPEDTFEPREECSLHFMVSHSTDLYPHPGLDEIWEGSSRYRRAIGSGTGAFARFALPPGVDPATHPIENGVILTPYGPVALGTLLTGIAASSMNNEVTIANVFGGTEVNYMPEEMSSKRLSPLHVATLAGDIGQSALVASLTSTLTKVYLGPVGRFANSTAAPKLFTLGDGYNGAIAYLTRAEIFAGIDALLIQESLRSLSSSKLKLSQLLRMYYSDRGLPNFPDSRACNRMNAFRQFGYDSKIKEQALNFAYAYADYFSGAATHIEENREDYPAIESYFQTEVNNVWSAFSNFVGGYSYEDYDRCPTYSKGNVKCENWADLVVVYSREGGSYETEKERKYMTLLAEMIGVSETRSRLGVLDGKSGNWILEVSNVSNIADLGSNFTMDTQYASGSSGDFLQTLDKLRLYYFNFYRVMNSSAENATANAQVVVWNVPKNAPDFEDEETQDILKDFHLDFPNVYFLLVGSSIGSYEKVLNDSSKDFFKTSYTDIEDFAKSIADRVCQIPSVFVYPACDTNNENFTRHSEGSHHFTGYVSPNYTTYAMIAPHNFRFSPYVKLTVKTSEVKVCASRLSMNVENTAEDYQCQDGNSNFEFEWDELCGRYLSECRPIYLSITGTPSGTPRCENEDCEYPNQVEYEISHEGMVCGAWSSTISLLMLLIVALLHLFLV